MDLTSVTSNWTNLTLRPCSVCSFRLKVGANKSRNACTKAIHDSLSFQSSDFVSCCQVNDVALRLFSQNFDSFISDSTVGTGNENDALIFCRHIRDEVP